ncbi:hypothetical protein M3Y99_00101100 [Aphelenchoides fujianensis]|nr:hypothetical protein M3Y99_00101100 [Aphelenchoides fujianensis]
MMIDEDHNAPYYRTAPSSSEGELSDDADEAAGGDAPKEVVLPASTNAEELPLEDAEEPKAAARPSRPLRPRNEAPAATPPTTSARPEGRRRPVDRTERSPPPKRRHDSPPRTRSPGFASRPTARGRNGGPSERDARLRVGRPPETLALREPRERRARGFGDARPLAALRRRSGGVGRRTARPAGRRPRRRRSEAAGAAERRGEGDAPSRRVGGQGAGARRTPTRPPARLLPGHPRLPLHRRVPAAESRLRGHVRRRLPRGGAPNAGRRRPQAAEDGARA